MKSLKTKLFASIVTLSIAFALMISSSYAWFTLSTNPEIKGMDTKVVVNENLEIAYRDSTTAPGATKLDDATKADTYGNLVDATSTGKTTDGETATFVTDFAALDKTLRPCTLVSGAFKTADYDVDGRPKAEANYKDLTVADPNSGTGVGNIVDASANNLVYGYYVQFWVRTNVEGKLQLSAAALRSTGAADADIGTGSKFVIDGTDTDVTTVQKKSLLNNLAVAYKLEGEGISSPAITALSWADTTITDDSTERLFKDATDSINTLGTLKANKDYKLTIYVYLEGKNVTNAAASIDGAVVGGTLNLQFKNSNIKKGSMDKAPAN